MPSIKDLKKRIGTVKNTQQTTRAMKMVSAAKLRRAQDAILANRPYAKHLNHLLKLVSAQPQIQLKGKLIRSGSEEAETRRILLVVVTSDRGLCGGFNGNIIRSTQRWVRTNQARGEVHLAFVGRKGFEYFRGRKEFQLDQYFAEAGGKVTFAKARKLADALIGKFLEGAFDEVHVIYNEFKNAVSQIVRTEQFLPLSLDSAGETDTPSPMLIVKPASQAIFDALVDKSFATQLFRMMLDSQASEHGARMSAMENATKNAGGMIKKLTLQFNKQRQAGITKELLEIIAGSESQKGA
ncbi:MAG: ATP synthase F1 subunit gamma [Bdellovibrionales bacterium]|nr:ATP synthase F1 subunit gamma [Bdellovibrionales bacterium]